MPKLASFKGWPENVKKECAIARSFCVRVIALQLEGAFVVEPCSCTLNQVQLRPLQVLRRSHPSLSTCYLPCTGCSHPYHSPAAPHRCTPCC